MAQGFGAEGGDKGDAEIRADQVGDDFETVDFKRDCRDEAGIAAEGQRCFIEAAFAGQRNKRLVLYLGQVDEGAAG